jgi:hypothetical protein
VFIVFRRDIASMIVAFFTLIKKAATTRRLREITPDERMLVMVAFIATVAACRSRCS